MKKLLFSISLFFSVLACQKQENTPPIASDGIDLKTSYLASVNNSTDKLTEITHQFGVTNINNIEKSDVRLDFDLNAISSRVNGVYMNLDKSKMTFEKIDQNVKLTLSSKTYGTSFIEIDKNEGNMSFTIKDTTYNFKKNSIQKIDDITAKNIFIFLLSTVGEVTDSALRRSNFENFRTSVDMSCVYYIVDYGATQTSALYFAREGAKQYISSHKSCGPLGENSSCAWGETICIGIVTLLCTNCV
jgi:hypothetical protein